MATTKDDIEKGGGKCTDKDGKEWWCDAEQCEPAPRVRPHPGGIIHIKLDVYVKADESGGYQVAVRPKFPGDSPASKK